MVDFFKLDTDSRISDLYLFLGGLIKKISCTYKTQILIKFVLLLKYVEFDYFWQFLNN